MRRFVFPSQQQIYDHSPHWLQRILVNVEAVRREWFRRHGDYRQLVARTIHPGTIARVTNKRTGN